MEVPRSKHISMNPTVLPFNSVLNGGNCNGGKPDLTLPIKYRFKLINLNQFQTIIMFWKNLVFKKLFY